MSNNTDHRIPLQQAVTMTTLYRTNRPQNFPVCETFHKSAVEQLLANTDAAYLRIYYGMKDSGEVDVILVAANSLEEDLLPAENDSSGVDIQQENLILEDGIRCPQYCPPSSPLNA